MKASQMTVQSRRTRVILLVEDDPADRAIVGRAFQSSEVAAELRMVGDGQEALDYLYRLGRYADPADAPRPDLLLVDLNMPGVDGKELIRTLRADPRFHTVPIVALTTSNSERDVRETYALGANSYVVKPAGIDALRRVLDSMQAYWFETVQLPPAA